MRRNSAVEEFTVNRLAVTKQLRRIAVLYPGQRSWTGADFTIKHLSWHYRHCTSVQTSY